MTVAAIQVPIPLMETPSEKTSVTSSATNVEISATPPIAEDAALIPSAACSRETAS